jgi:hypothetical protein
MHGAKPEVYRRSEQCDDLGHEVVPSRGRLLGRKEVVVARTGDREHFSRVEHEDSEFELQGRILRLQAGRHENCEGVCRRRGAPLACSGIQPQRA